VVKNSNRWIIVGGCASGMAAAFFLKQHGIDSEIIERQRTLGGRIGSVTLGERALDCGGKNIGKQYRLFRKFTSSLGSHEFEYFGLNSSQMRGGQPVTFDASRRWRSLVGTVRGMSSRDILRFGKILWHVKSKEGDGYLGSDYSRALAVRHDHRPVSEYFTPEFCRRVVRPMSVRMNGAEPDEIFMGNLGANVRMLLDTYEQLKDGSAPMIKAFTNTFRVRLNSTCESLITQKGRVTGITIRHGNGRREDLDCPGIIVATPAPVAAALAEPILPRLASHLRSVAYYPVVLVLAEYSRSVFSSAVRALVFDESDIVSNAGAYGVNDLNLVRYTFSGRAARHQILKSVGIADMLGAGEEILNRHVPVKERKRVRFVARHFTYGLCAYTPFHASFLDNVRYELRKTAGLYLTGDYMQGASIEACFRSANDCVHNLISAENGRPGGDIGQ
jgi:protoporphyrinogen/coproporphyrinogen III oxidase